MKTKTIKAVLTKKISQWIDSITDNEVRDLARKNTIVTGGCIASMLLKEKVNDFDIYFRNRKTVEAVAKYYVDLFNKNTGSDLKIDLEKSDRVRIVTGSGHRGETAGDVKALTDATEIEEAYEGAESAALQEDEKPEYRPVFFSTNALTLSNKVQLIFRFYGEPEEIHKNYDFIHCTNYWQLWDGELVLHQKALESLMARELIYVGSKYPVASLFRIRKFIQRNWTINAGQILKIILQTNELDLFDVKVLEDQLTGVDVAYFISLIGAIKKDSPEKINSAYLVEIINRMF